MTAVGELFFFSTRAILFLISSGLGFWYMLESFQKNVQNSFISQSGNDHIIRQD